MKKVLFVCDTDHFPEGALNFIRSLHQQEEFLLVGAFFHAANLNVFIPADYVFDPASVFAGTEEDKRAVSKSMRIFEQKCIAAGLEYRIHEGGEEFKAKELVMESRFADVMLISEQLFFRQSGEQPNPMMTEILSRSECPVLLVPEDLKPIEQITIAYDGSKESMFALKQFCYLFPSLTRLPAEIMHWVQKSDDDIPGLEYITEYAARHFSNLNFRECYFNFHEFLVEWSLRHKPLLICGGYKKGIASLFKSHFAEDIINEHSAIVFIAHP